MIYLRRVMGKSMLPTFKEGQIIWFLRRRHYKPGDVVLVEHNGLDKIKRIQQINGQKVWVLGDNPSHSTDSRHFGAINLGQIVAARRRNLIY